MTVLQTNIQEALAAPLQVPDKQINFFRKNGFVKLKNVLSTDAIVYINETISKEVNRLNTQHLPLEERSTYGKAFLQVTNVWTRSGSEAVKEIVFSKRLAKIAADLLGLDGIRLFHDQVLYKEPGGGVTPWHADQYYWPFSNDLTVTAWIPLQETSLEMGPLEFSSQSHTLTTGRDKEISDESEQILQQTLKNEGYKHIVEAFEIGEVSFHRGWVFHRAGANRSDKMRSVMTMIYMDKNMKLEAPVNKNQADDWERWWSASEIGKQIDTPIYPVLYHG